MKENLLRNLTRYSAVAATILGVQKETSAQVVYNDIPDTLITQQDPPYFLDLNNDGIFDFRFYAGNFNASYVSVHGLVPGNSEVASTLSTSWSVAYPILLGMSTPVSASQSWPGNGYPGFLGNGSDHGNFPGAVDGYLGVRFMIGANLHYGWIRMDVSPVSEWMLIKDFAYDSLPNTGINAGQCFCPPTNVENEEAVNSKILVFPNPASDEINIHFTMEKPGNLVIDLSDVNGRRIKTIAERNFSEGMHQLLLQKENLGTGVYLLQIKNENGIISQRLIIQ